MVLCAREQTAHGVRESTRGGVLLDAQVMARRVPRAVYLVRGGLTPGVLPTLSPFHSLPFEMAQVDLMRLGGDLEHFRM